MSSISFIIIIILVIIQTTFNAYAADIYNGTASVPPNGGEWYACSDFSTKYISFSIRVSETNLTLTPDFIGTNVPGKPTNESTPKYRPGVIVYQMTEANVKIFSDLSSKSEFTYIPSLSCYKKPIQSCDQDVGTLLLSEQDIQCLAVQNPTGKTVFFNISLSFKVSVFGDNVFTSPDVPGGNEVTLNNTNSTSSTSSASSYNNNYLIMNNNNRFGVIIITLMVIGLGKMITL
ncbi:hypothetical protein Glove_303g61 [Diversispora epigaea]|uniref:Uncharacterized protein n=1 Tax=Diversispora epigaea TaxID=1348612 RepID=A0A397HUX4_9GLOM|nr:hypothetical protein Glove_303g61 [Diversispora epigaea]